ncbi:MAG: hypothetical protein H0T45_04945 [Pyrinomonadaceae bacterium]|nr:hypothetical protein [Pyrinomonadaceae bacterium]
MNVTSAPAAFEVVGHNGKHYSAEEIHEQHWQLCTKSLQQLSKQKQCLKTFSSQRNAEAYYEMMQWVNSGSITFETGNQIEGKVTIEDYAGKALK